jgi:glucose/arabinose dehydrogenase
MEDAGGAAANGAPPAWRKVAQVQGLPKIVSSGQGGLFDVALHPQFQDNAWVYLAYNAADANGAMGTELMRAKLEIDSQGKASLREAQTLFVMQPKSRGGRHFGGRIAFDKQGYVFLSLGDRGEEARAQKTKDHAGSVIRLHDDGRVPQDNPWVGQAKYYPEKFTLGQRNIQGMALEPSTGLLWSHEHGPQGGDEINPVEAGKNYGWPVISYGVNYVIGTKIGEGTHKAGMEQPWTVWVPSIAPSGMAFYSGNAFPAWQGDMLVGALRGQMLVRLRKLSDKWVEQERLLEGQIGRIRDVRVGPDGLVYVLTDSPDGQLLRLRP